MKMEYGSQQDGQRPFDMRERPQPQFRANLTVAVVDPQALWTAAAAGLLATTGTTLDDVLDVIGPREDPSIVDCIATLSKPSALPGCIMDDFWVDSLRGCPPRIDFASAVIDYTPGSTDRARRAAPPRRAAPRLALCILPATNDTTRVN